MRKTAIIPIGLFALCLIFVLILGYTYLRHKHDMIERSRKSLHEQLTHQDSILGDNKLREIIKKEEIFEEKKDIIEFKVMSIVSFSFIAVLLMIIIFYVFLGISNDSKKPEDPDDLAGSSKEEYDKNILDTIKMLQKDQIKIENHITSILISAFVIIVLIVCLILYNMISFEPTFTKDGMEIHYPQYYYILKIGGFVTFISLYLYLFRLYRLTLQEYKYIQMKIISLQEKRSRISLLREISDPEKSSNVLSPDAVNNLNFWAFTTKDWGDNFEVTHKSELDAIKDERAYLKSELAQITSLLNLLVQNFMPFNKSKK